MHQIYMQKTTAKCIKFIWKKQCEMRQIHMQKTLRNALLFWKFSIFFCIWILRIFQCFLQENLQKFVWQFSIFFKLFRYDFYETVSRDGKGGSIPVKSRCKCGNPDRDCTENIRFCSAMSTKSEISQKNGWPLVLTATHQFNAENEVFETVRAKIGKKLVFRTRCWLKWGENCALREWNCTFFAVSFWQGKVRSTLVKNGKKSLERV